MAGPPVFPPLWALDSIWWRDDDHVGFHGMVMNAQENVLDDATQLQNNQIRAGSLWIDRPYGTGVSGWGNMDFDSSFPDPLQMVGQLHTQGYQLMLWIFPLSTHI
jgi:alpha-glucosidase (family GH31 glycosyl hydrolase)